MLVNYQILNFVKSIGIQFRATFNDDVQHFLKTVGDDDRITEQNINHNYKSLIIKVIKTKLLILAFIKLIQIWSCI
jgi:hypothetical protein